MIGMRSTTRPFGRAIERSAGAAVFEGFQTAAVVGHGGYHGTWTRP
jgi:hypothetical protein